MLTLVKPQRITEAWCATWTWVADPGAHVDEPEGKGRFVAFFITLGGMLIFALLIGKRWCYQPKTEREASRGFRALSEVESPPAQTFDRNRL